MIEPPKAIALTADGRSPVSHPVRARDYDWADPGGLLPDPARAAEREGLVDCHELAVRRKIGAWRWPPLQRHRERLLPLIVGKRVIDFGGYAGPIGYGAIVVDRLAKTRALWDVLGQVHVICAIHTLEHVADLPCLLASCRYKLVRGGHLIAIVPSWRDTQLNADKWPHHAWTFALSTDAAARGRQTYLDHLVLQMGFDLLAGEDDGENIFLLAQKPNAESPQ